MDLIERTLRERVDDVVLHEAAPETIRRRAAQVRARRRAAATSAIAGLAVAAAVVGTVGIGSELGHRTPQVVSPSPRAISLGSLASLRQGARPGIGYGLGPQLHLADGATLQAPSPGTYSFWLPLAKSLVIGNLAGGRMVGYQGTHVTESNFISGEPALSADRKQIAWTGGKGTIEIARASGRHWKVDSRLAPGVRGVTGFLSGGRVVIAATGGAEVVDRQGVEKLPRLAAPTASSQATGLVAGELRGGGFGVVDPASGRLLWRSDLQLSAFSPDGHYVAAGPSGSDRQGLTVLDARTGAVVRTLRVGGGVTVLGRAWEDDTHVLAVVVDRHEHQQAIVRLSAGGRVELATGLVSDEATTTLQITP